jgi:hypothetical protein
MAVEVAVLGDTKGETEGTMRWGRGRDEGGR